MAVYYVVGACLVAWGLGLAIFGLLRADFPPAGRSGRPFVLVTVLLVIGTLTALLLSTHKEHPKAEAAAKAKEAKAQAPAPATAPSAGAKSVKVSEKEFSIVLAGGNKLTPGAYTFAVGNTGKIQHDLAIEGSGIKETKTPLINAGQTKDLSVDLKPGTYKFYCTVPGHEQSGMKVEVTVAGGAASKKAAPSKKKKAPAKAAAKTVNVTEKEFSIALAGGNSLKAGSYKFAVRNTGKIQHDLAVQGAGLNGTKTKLIDAGKGADLNVALKPGKYTFFCSVPGHEQAGMKVAVTVK